MLFIRLILFNSANISYLFWLISMICTNKDNKAVANSGYTKLYFMIRDSLKTPLSYFWYFHCSNFKTTFNKKSKKKATIFLFLSDLYYVTNYYVLLTVRSKMVVLRNLRTRLFCLVSISKFKTYEISNCCSF